MRKLLSLQKITKYEKSIMRLYEMVIIELTFVSPHCMLIAYTLKFMILEQV